MPRDYAVQVAGQILPHNVYMQIVYMLKDYHRMCRERESLLFSSSFNDGQPRGSGVGDPTANKAVKLAALSERVNEIDSVVHSFNAEYSNKIRRDDIETFDALEAFDDYGCFCYMLYDPNSGKQPAYITWKRFRSRMAYEIAKKLKLF